MKSSRFALALALAAPLSAAATDVNVIGLFPGKAVVSVNRGAPRTLSVGERTSEGVVLVASDSKGAVLEIDGKRQTLEMGQHFESASLTGERQSVTLAAGERGHFGTGGSVDGGHMRFLVDTGATLVSMASSDATRLGIDYRKGRPTVSVMADGRRVASYRITLDTVSVGDLTLL